MRIQETVTAGIHRTIPEKESAAEREILIPSSLPVCPNGWSNCMHLWTLLEVGDKAGGTDDEKAFPVLARHAVFVFSHRALVKDSERE